jgi:hypothetical protein
MTNVSSVTKHFPSAEEGFTTTLSSTISAGATTVGVNSLSGYTTGEVATFIVAPTVSSEKQVFTGVVDTAGLQLTNVVWTTGTNQTHAAGTTVVDYATATHISQMSKGILAEHNQDGSHGAVTASSVASSGAVSGTTGTFSSDITEKGATLTAIRNEHTADFVASGGVWSGDSYGSTRNASMTALVCYINGQRGTISAVTARSFTASKDTYIDVLNTAGTFSLVYTEVTNNAASPALAANSLRLGIVVTGASNIASVASINQGQPDKTVPTTTNKGKAGLDSLGNRIRPLSPVDNGITFTAFTSMGSNSTSYTDGVSITVALLNDSRVVVDASSFGMWQGAPAVTAEMQVLRDATQILYNRVDVYTTSQNWAMTAHDTVYMPAGTYTVKIQTKHTQGGSSFLGTSLKLVAYRV